MELAVVAIGAIALWVAVAYNRLVRARNLVREAWSGIDVQLKRRHDLVPKLVAVVSAYAKHEREVLERVTRARSRVAEDADTRARAGAGAGARQEHENQLSDRLQSLLAVAERYPELLADRSFADLHARLVEIEDRTQMARRYYNGSVRDLNIRVESFPGNLVAGLFGFETGRFFEVAAATEREVPAVRVDS